MAHPLVEAFLHAADLMALLNENSFRVLATRKVARILEGLPHLPPPLDAHIPGLGESSREKIREFVASGRIAEFQDLADRVPPGVLDLMHLPGIGPKTAGLFWHEAGITSLSALQAALPTDALENLPGMGAKKIAKLRQALADASAARGRLRLGEAQHLADAFLELLRPLPGLLKATPAGSLRRGQDSVGDLDLLLCGPESLAPQIQKLLSSSPLVAKIDAAGATKITLHAHQGTQVDLRLIPPESWGAALQYFTGSKEHNVRLRERAAARGLKLNEWGLWQDQTLLAGDREEAIYEALGLAWMAPELREDRGEIPAAQQHFNAGTPFEPLVEVTDLRGDLHLHTLASDGSLSLEELVALARQRGYQYLAVTDHSKSQFQAHGLSSERLIEHIQAIRALAAKLTDIWLLAGSEVDILADGSLDYEDDLLAQLDWVVASPHAALTQDSEAATRRLVRAIANPHVCLLGHPTGRLVLKRKGLEPDMGQVVAAAARAGVALEINASDYRLDLRDLHVRLAVEAGVPLCINTDTHGPADLDQRVYGVLTARRGWAKPADVLNTRDRQALAHWLATRKSW